MKQTANVSFLERKGKIIPGFFLGMVLLFIPFASFSQNNPGLNRIVVPIGGGRVDSAFLYLPWDYKQSSKNYPLVIFDHGTGEAGNNLNLTLNQGLTGVINQGNPPYAVVNGDTTRFIVLAPQDRWHSWTVYPDEIHYALKDILNRGYRIDTTRLYLTGLSAGGGATLQYPNDYPTDGISAYVPLSSAGPANTNDVSPYKTSYIWAFCGNSDPLEPYSAQIVDAVNAAYPGHGRLTLYPGGHCCWMTYYNPGYRENINGKMMNIYEWMLQYSNNGTPPPPPVNLPPIANAGSNDTIILPLDSVMLDGSASNDPDGTISAYKWALVSGPTQYAILNPNNVKTSVNNLVSGTYIFQLTVTDNLGATATATVTIKVNAAIPPPPPPPAVPVANAGKDTVITLPNNTITLDGSGSYELNGKITNFLWGEKSGPSQYSITNPYAAQTSVTNLTAGQYIFQLTVRDSAGALASSQVAVTVNNPIPPVLASGRKKIYLSSPNGTIAYDQVDSQLGVGAGDTICISAGSYKYIRLGGIVGAKDAPIVIQNCGGVVKIGANNVAPYAFMIDSSQYFEVSGSGTPNTEYGFEIVGTSDASGGQRATGLILNNRCSDFDVHNIFIHDILAQGIVSLTYANCNDPRTWRKNFVQKNTKYHHIKIYNVGLEGFYIGRTFPVEENTPCGDTIPNPLIQNCNIYDNIVDSTGKGGIQLSLALLGTNKIFNNTVTKWGYMNYPGGYNVGIAVGGATNADVFNNTIHDGPGIGIQLLGSGLTRIYNNLFYNINVNASDGIQSGDRFTAGPYTLYAFNNTFVNIARFAINIYGSNSKIDNLLFNNYIVHCDTAAVAAPFKGISIPYWWIPNSILYQRSNNIYLDTIGDAKFKDPVTSDFHLVSGSPAIDQGKDLSQFGIISDLDGTPRPIGGGYDVGAFEYGGSAGVNKNPVADAGPDITLVLPESSAGLDGSSSFDPDGSIVTYRWMQTAGPSQTTIINPNISKPAISGLTVAGTYQFKLTVLDNKGDSSSSLTTVLVKTSTQMGPPVAVTGPDITVNLPKNSADLDGNASYDPGGVITEFKWTKVSGPDQYNFDAHYHNFLSLCIVNNLVAGTYIFQLLVTDDRGDTATALQRVIVTGSSMQSLPPVANAGKDIDITLPQNAVSLNGGGSYDPNGKIVSYSWAQVSGSNQAIIEGANSVSPFISGLVSGKYVFELTVTNDKGVTASATVAVAVEINDGLKNNPVISVYPNPASNFLYLKSINDIRGIMMVNFTDASGRVVKTYQFVKSQQSFFRYIDISWLPMGIYFVQMQLSSLNVTKKLIKMQ